jgi:hypothetical protein
LTQDRLKRTIDHSENPRKDKSCGECSKWAPEDQHHKDIMHESTQHENEHCGNQPDAISTQHKIESVKQMANARIPDSPESMKSWLTPAIDKSTLKDNELTRGWVISPKSQVPVIAFIEPALKHVTFSRDGCLRYSGSPWIVHQDVISLIALVFIDQGPPP